jgi:hypothetical protein
VTSTLIAARSVPETLANPSLAARRPISRDPVWPVLGLCAAAFAYGVTTIRSAAVSDYGLLATASPVYALSILLAGTGFAIAIRRRNFTAAVSATVLMIAVVRLPGSIATDTPLYAWTYKHLGVVDYIQHEHTLARGVDVYAGWPGVFAVTAWFSDLTGVPPVAIAHWFPVCFHLAFALMAYAAARAWGLVPLTAATAMFIADSLNWIDQDYYSPQAMAVIFAAALFIMVGLSRTKPVGVPLIILLFAAETITHQLTPPWVFMAITILAFTRKLKPWWIVIPLAAILFGFLLYNFDELAKQTETFSLNIFDNTKSAVPYPGSAGQQLTSLGNKFLSGSVWVTTVVTLVVRWRKKQPFWALGVLALSPFGILFGQNYGNEAIYRVFLYSLLGCSLVLAPVVVTVLQSPRTRSFCGWVVLLVAVALSAQGYLSIWFADRVVMSDVDESKKLFDRVEFPAHLRPAAPFWPERITWRYVDYARFSKDYDEPVIFENNLQGSHFNTDKDYKNFCDAIDMSFDATTYVVFTEQMRLMGGYFGYMPSDAVPNLKARLARDPSWILFRDVNGVTIYEHRVETS